MPDRVGHDDAGVGHAASDQAASDQAASDQAASDQAASDQASGWKEALRAKGYRLTPQRELILGAVDDLGHATPDEVLAHVRRQASTVNASTVYRTLEVLEELGLIRHAHLSDRAPTYHSTRGDVHFHLVCRRCRRVISVSAEDARAFVEDLEARHRFTPDIGHLTVFGTCRDCTEAIG